MTAENRRGGRPRTRTDEDRPAPKGAYIGFKAPEALKERADAAAAGSGRSLSTETSVRLAQTFRDEEALSGAMALAYGADNAGLAHLIGRIIGRVSPRGAWIDDRAGFDVLARSVIRVLQRLRAPEDGHFIEGSSPEAIVDALLYDLGDDGSDHPGPLLAHQRWAAEERPRFGPALARRLIEMRRAVQEAMPSSRELPELNSETAELWDRVIARVNAAPPSTPQEYVDQAKESIDRLLNDPERAPAWRASNLFVAGCMVRDAAQHGVGAEGQAELQRLIAEAKRNLPAPAAGEPSEP